MPAISPYYSSRANALVAKFVSDKVRRLQSEYTKASGASPQSRATLAQLRHSIGLKDVSWMATGGNLFAEWPDELDNLTTNDPAFQAARTTLELYALHQQSQASPVAQFDEKEYSKRVSFGKACRLINRENANDPGVFRRLTSAENAPTFTGTSRNIRSLILMMRSAKNGPIQLDYGMLASDLYRLQFDNTRGGVFKRWSFDFFHNTEKKTEDE